MNMQKANKSPRLQALEAGLYDNERIFGSELALAINESIMGDNTRLNVLGEFRLAKNRTGTRTDTGHYTYKVCDLKDNKDD